MKEVVAIFTAVVLALAIWLGPRVFHAYQDTKYLAGFSKIHDAKTPLTTAQVEEAMGRPASIEQSESADQTVTGTVYHYPAHGQDLKVIFVNGVVFDTRFVPTGKP